MLGQGSKIVKGNIVTTYACFCSTTMFTSKIIPEIMENHSEGSGCANSCNKFVSLSPFPPHKFVKFVSLSTFQLMDVSSTKTASLIILLILIVCTTGYSVKRNQPFWGGVNCPVAPPLSCGRSAE